MEKTMRNFKLIILIIFIQFFSTNVFSQEKSNRVAEGARLYSENCARCHNARPASDYTKREWSVVMPHMREKAHMTGTEALAVEAFIDSTLTADVRNDETPNSNLNADDLITQFGCQGCHQINAVGGNLGPALNGVVVAKGREFVINKLKDPKFNNAASAMPQFPMTEQDINTIVDFLAQLDGNNE